MVQSKQIDFNGQTIFCGIDVHKNSWKVNLRLKEMDLKTFSQAACAKTLEKHLKTNYPGARYLAVYEAGFSGFSHQRIMQGSGIDCLVVHPADIPSKDKDRKHKTDTVDCRKLSKSLSEGSLDGIYIPSEEQQNDRGVIRVYLQMIKDQTRSKNRIKSWLDFHGINIPDKGHWSNNFLQWLQKLSLNESSRVHLDLLLQSYNNSRAMVLKATKEIRILSKSERYREEIKIIRSVPGIGQISGLLFATEIGDVNRFKGLDPLCDYCGLVPKTHSSGVKEHTDGLTHRGHKELREKLIEASWVAIRIDPALTLAFSDYCRRMNKNKAIIKIARKLLNRVRYVMKNKKEYVSSIVK